MRNKRARYIRKQISKAFAAQQHKPRIYGIQHKTRAKLDGLVYTPVTNINEFKLAYRYAKRAWANRK